MDRIPHLLLGRLDGRLVSSCCTAAAWVLLGVCHPLCLPRQGQRLHADERLRPGLHVGVQLEVRDARVRPSRRAGELEPLGRAVALNAEGRHELSRLLRRDVRVHQQRRFRPPPLGGLLQLAHAVLGVLAAQLVQLFELGHDLVASGPVLRVDAQEALLDEQEQVLDERRTVGVVEKLGGLLFIASVVSRPGGSRTHIWITMAV